MNTATNKANASTESTTEKQVEEMMKNPADAVAKATLREMFERNGKLAKTKRISEAAFYVTGATFFALGVGIRVRDMIRERSNAAKM